MNYKNQIFQLVSKIPLGKVTTYKIIGQKLGLKNYRLIGQILNKNPKPIKIPCHRVVKSNGEIGGYKFGINKKKNLLKKEGIIIKNNKIMNFNKIIYK